MTSVPQNMAVSDMTPANSDTFVSVRSGHTALVLDSPHSGTRYPADFGYCCDLALLRRAEDTHVEKLYDFANAAGAAWVEALFPPLPFCRHDQPLSG